MFYFYLFSYVFIHMCTYSCANLCICTCTCVFIDTCMPIPCDNISIYIYICILEGQCHFCTMRHHAAIYIYIHTRKAMSFLRCIICVKHLGRLIVCVYSIFTSHDMCISTDCHRKGCFPHGCFLSKPRMGPGEAFGTHPEPTSSEREHEPRAMPSLSLCGRVIASTPRVAWPELGSGQVHTSWVKDTPWERLTWSNMKTVLACLYVCSVLFWFGCLFGCLFVCLMDLLLGLFVRASVKTAHVHEGWRLKAAGTLLRPSFLGSFPLPKETPPSASHFWVNDNGLARAHPKMVVYVRNSPPTTLFQAGEILQSHFV